MAEIALGLVVVLGAAALLMGAGAAFGLPGLAPLFGIGGAAAIAIAGLLLIARGAYRLALKRNFGNRHAMRTAGLMSVAAGAIAFLALVIPLMAVPLNVIRIGGFPAGYYMAAQGSLIALVILVFAAARRADAIDAESSAPR